MDSLKYYRDLKASFDTKFEEGELKGRIEGKIEGKIELARELLKKGISIEMIVEVSGLTRSQIENMTNIPSTE